MAASLPLVVLRPAVAAAGDITTVAGGGGAGPATGVGQTPGGVAVVGDVVYVADLYYNVVRRIEGGSETIVAGHELAAALGDGGPARAAQLKAPSGVAADAAGNLYIADRTNNRVRKVDHAGTITTVAGQGTAGYGGDGLAATLALLSAPSGVAVSGDFLYIADSANHRVRKVVLSTGVISTYAGLPLGAGGGATGGDGGQADLAQLASPAGVAVDAAGNLFIADTAHNLVRKVTLSTGIIATVAGTPDVSGFSGDGGQATAAKLNNPGAVAVDGSGNLLVADTVNHRVRRVDATTGVIDTVAGMAVTPSDHYGGDGGPGTSAKLSSPQGVAVTAGGSVVIADTGNSRVRLVAAGGQITTMAGAGEPGFGGEGRPAPEAQLRRPTGVAIAPDGSLYVTDTANIRVRHIGNDGVITTVAGRGVRCPLPNGANCGDGGMAVDAQLTDPSGVAFGPDGLYITTNNRVRRIGADGTITTVAGTGEYGFTGDDDPAGATGAKMFQPVGMAFDQAGNLFIADSSNNRVRRVDALSHVITTVAGGGAAPTVSTDDNIGDGGPARSAVLKTPSAVALDRAGNLFITDPGQQRVRLVVPGPDGFVNGGDGETITTVAGKANTVAGAPGGVGDGGTARAASLRSPAGLAFRDGSLLISDSGDNRIRQVVAGADGKVTGGADEIITTVAGTGTSGYAGDAGPATAALLSGPAALAVAATGRLFIADAGNQRIRSVQGPDVPPPVPPTIVGAGGNAQHAAIGASFAAPLRATVRDSAGRPATGVDVTFTAPASGPSGSFPGASLSATTATDADGVATAPNFTANSHVGSYQVRATAAGVLGSAVYGLVNDHGPAASITASAGTPQSSRVDTEFTTRLAATVVDAGENPVPGASVTFSAPDAEPSGTFDTPSGGTDRAITVASGADGVATATAFVAGRVPGSYTVSAVVEGVASAGTFALTNAPEGGGVVSAVRGTPQDAPAGSTFPVGLEVAVRSASDAPVEGVDVTFGAPGSGPSGTFEGGVVSATVRTGADGHAVAPAFTANTTPGSYTVSAATPAADGSASFSLANTAVGATSVVAAGGTPQQAPVGTAFGYPLQALVRDRDGNRVPGVAVVFSAPPTGPSGAFPGGSSTATATTDGRGIAGAPAFVANRQAGSYVVAAAVEGVEGRASFALTNAAAPAEPTPPCGAVAAGPGQVAYPAGFSLVGLPGGTRLPAGARLWAWLDQGRGGQYAASEATAPLVAGRGYWRWFACPTAVDVAPGGAAVSLPLGSYHASMVGNPSDHPVSVTGQDYAARYDRTLNAGAGGYRMSGYREPQTLAPGEGLWVFAYTDTTVRITP